MREELSDNGYGQSAGRAELADSETLIATVLHPSPPIALQHVHGWCGYAACNDQPTGVAEEAKWQIGAVPDRCRVGRAVSSQQAQQEAGKMGHEAQQVAGQVAHQAAGQGNQVMTEGRHQARNLAGQASAQLREQAGTQQKRAVDRLRTFGTELGSMANKTDQHGIASDMAQRASDAAQQAAGWLEEREPGALVDEVRDYARRRPGAFLAGAVVAGLVVGRLTRGLAAGSGSSATGAGDPAGDGHRRDSAEMPPSGTAQPEMAQSGRVSGAQTVQTPDAGKGVTR